MAYIIQWNSAFSRHAQYFVGTSGVFNDMTYNREEAKRFDLRRQAKKVADERIGRQYEIVKL